LTTSLVNRGAEDRRLHPLAVARTAFIFAHPDDDTLIAGTMRELLERGAEVHGIWVTSGEREEPRKSMRHEETLEAMAVLGLPRDRIHILDLPFLGLLKVLDHAADLLARLLADIAPEQVFTVGYEGGHIDHDAVNFLAYEAMWRGGLSVPLYEFPLYNGDGPLHWYGFRVNAFPRSPGAPPTLHLRLGPSALKHKFEAMSRYRSQWGYMTTFRWVAFFRGFARRGEPYRWCPDTRDHAAAPHRGRLNIERWFNRYMDVSFRDFQEAVRSVRRRP
jgi:LmbE family N-acetylglucosaminyl deacetylase